MRLRPLSLAALLLLAAACGNSSKRPAAADGGAHGDGGGSPCGACPTGYACGTANGKPVCRAPSGIPVFSHVFVIVMENTSLSTLDDPNNDKYVPFIRGLEKDGATHSDYHGVAHPSLPNYVALTSGGIQGIGCDCDPTGSACTSIDCNAILHSCGCPAAVPHLGDALDAAGVTWRDYGESMGTPCNTTTAGSYAARHVPFLYFPSVQTDTTRCDDHVVDFSDFAADLAAGARRFSLVAPNLTDDMHDPFPAGSQNLQNGDHWLSQQIPAIQSSAAYAEGGLIVIVWDEDDDSGAISADAPIPLIVLSPFAKQGGFVATQHADHYSLLATIEDGLGVPRPRLGAAEQATPLAELFPAN